MTMFTMVASCHAVSKSPMLGGFPQWRESEITGAGCGGMEGEGEGKKRLD